MPLLGWWPATPTCSSYRATGLPSVLTWTASRARWHCSLVGALAMSLPMLVSTLSQRWTRVEGGSWEILSAARRVRVEPGPKSGTGSWFLLSYFLGL